MASSNNDHTQEKPEWNKFYDEVYELIKKEFGGLAFALIVNQNFLESDLDTEYFYYTAAQRQYEKMLEDLDRFQNPAKKDNSESDAWEFLFSSPRFSKRESKYITNKLDSEPISGTLQSYFRGTKKPFLPREIIKSERFTLIPFFYHTRDKTDLFTSFPIIINDQKRGSAHIVYKEEDKEAVQEDKQKLEDIIKKLSEIALKYV